MFTRSFLGIFVIAVFSFLGGLIGQHLNIATATPNIIAVKEIRLVDNGVIRAKLFTANASNGEHNPVLVYYDAQGKLTNAITLHDLTLLSDIDHWQKIIDTVESREQNFDQQQGH